MNNIVNVPDELLVSRILLSEIINRDYDKIAIVLLGENMDLLNYREELSVIRLYLFLNEGGKYHYEKELEAFSFDGLAPAMEFLKELPEMSALDLLLRIHAPNHVWDGYRMH